MILLVEIILTVNGRVDLGFVVAKNLVEVIFRRNCDAILQRDISIRKNSLARLRDVHDF